MGNSGRKIKILIIPGMYRQGYRFKGRFDTRRCSPE
jgi:hypothetical protein